jgi:hypothetical protein
MESKLAEIKKSDQVVLVCARCKKIRDDQGCWIQADTPLEMPINAVFSHGLCPDCMRELYPEVADKILKRQGAGPQARAATRRFKP